MPGPLVEKAAATNFKQRNLHAPEQPHRPLPELNDLIVVMIFSPLFLSTTF
jgi:hypothetical protein